MTKNTLLLVLKIIFKCPLSLNVEVDNQNPELYPAIHIKKRVFHEAIQEIHFRME